MKDPDPFVSQCADDGLVAFTFRFLLFVESISPERQLDGFASPFNEGLSQELRATISPMDPRFIATAFKHWGDAAVLLDVFSGWVARTVVAEGG